MYTHQLANTFRILSDIRVRHLLADEVGLGKTVQALMVLNALKNQRKDLRALVVVPDRLVSQWRDEIMTRAHSAPIEHDAEPEETQYITLAWEGLLRQKGADGNPIWTLSDVSSANYEVLVVDELHRLRADVQDRIVKASFAFEHVLILTATPAFQRPERHAQIFAILEPERVSIARWSTAQSEKGVQTDIAVGDNISSWPGWAVRRVVETLLEQDRAIAEDCEDDGTAREAAALTHCAYRRVIRTRRVDYSGVLPQRRHVPIVTEPLDAEADRQRLMWRYFGYLGELSREFDPVLLAKRVVLSSPSLEQRVDFLRRKGHERNGLLEKVKPLVHRSMGDSRLDALVDLLAEVWSKDPAERVLVAAQDNLTVDYLFEMVQARLPMIGSLGDRIPLVAARVRQGMMIEVPEDLAGFGNETIENLEAFQRGEAQVLFAPEIAQVGLNLQCARILVLYSVPWRPEEVEQWIGRLDRIGNTAAFSAKGDEAKTIDVYTIVQRDLVDEKVVTVLQRYQVFERSVNLDGEHLSEVAQRIEVAALQPESTSWETLEEATEAMAIKDEVKEINSSLFHWLPWTVAWAKSLRQQIDSMRPVPPLLVNLKEHSNAGVRSWDRANEGMMKLLARASEYHIRLNEDTNGSRFQTLWYQFGEPGMFGLKEALSKVIFSFGADPGHEHSPKHAHAFITRRGDIGSQPRRYVTMKLNEGEHRRPLHFLNYGDPLHDELMKGWASSNGKTCAIDVSLFEDHSLFSIGVAGLYVIRISVVDPATVLKNDNVVDRSLEKMALAASNTHGEKLPELLRPYTSQLFCAFEADIRWLRAQLPVVPRVEGLCQRDGEWAKLDEDGIRALLNPMAHNRKGLPLSGTWESSHYEQEIATALECLREEDGSIARSAWSHLFPSFDRSLKLRRHSVYMGGRDAEALATLELEDSNRKLERAKERGNILQVRRTQTEVEMNTDKLNIIRKLWAARLDWLEMAGETIRDLSPEERLTAVIRVRVAA